MEFLIILNSDFNFFSSLALECLKLIVQFISFRKLKTYSYNLFFGIYFKKNNGKHKQDNKPVTMPQTKKITVNCKS